MELFNTISQKRDIFSVMKPDMKHHCEADNRVRSYVRPERIVWKTTEEQAGVENERVLLESNREQITLKSGENCILRNNGSRAGILLDFGVELHGGVQILVSSFGAKTSFKLRARFGESAMEAISEIGEKGSTNDHAIRDQIVEVSFLGMVEVGNTGFRFVRIDLMDEDSFIEIKSIRAVFIYKDINYKGSFRCNDELLNRVWNTGAYTVHLNMQNYLWDGIKRDRLVWVGDMHPETSVIQAVFGYDDVVPRSLDLIRDETRLPEWMNGIPTYSMWWIIIHYGWYMQNGELEYLLKQKEYLLGLLEQLAVLIDSNGCSITPEPRFTDWPSQDNKKATDAGIQALHIMAMEAGAYLCSVLNESRATDKCIESAGRLRQFLPCYNGSKQAAALMVLAGLADADSINRKVLSIDGTKRMSTFYGYYILKARARAGDICGSLDCIRQYWGGMLDIGATTFWEDFNVEWLDNACRIDEIVTEGMKDIHGDYGDYCYEGYRHSLCHGWSAGPTAWLSENVLGIRIIEPGCKTIKIKPALGDLEWAEGSYPTPAGIVHIRHEKQANGHIKSMYDLPSGINILKE
jgi:Bacterial alpha-L-rhamnosidase.